MDFNIFSWKVCCQTKIENVGIIFTNNDLPSLLIYALRVSIFMTSPLGVAVGLLSI